MKNNKGLIIGIVVFLVIAIIVAIVLISGSSKRRRQQELELQMAALQAQANNPNTNPNVKQGLLAQVANLAIQLATIKGNQPSGTGINQPGGGGTSQGTGIPFNPTSTSFTWTPTSSSKGICGNPASLNKDRILKNGVNGPEVCALQSFLNVTKNAGLVQDGAFGPKTQTALVNATGKTSITLKEALSITV